MHRLIQCKTIVLPLLIACVLTGFGLLPQAEAVVPPPDGGYPGGNTAEGQDALFSLTTGTYNTAVGLFSLASDTEGALNTALGAATLFGNTTGVANTATGAGALLFNTTGGQNTANGAFALFNNTAGSGNTANGFDALFSNTEGGGNTASGAAALFNNTTGSTNTAIGASALSGNMTGASNTASGAFALFSNSTGGSNTANGTSALGSNTTGNANTANGDLALFSNTTGSENTAVGAGALSDLDTGTRNTAVGVNANIFGINLADNTVVGANAEGTGLANTVIGANAFGVGEGSTVIGFNAVSGGGIFGGNTVIGAHAGSNLVDAANVICIDAAGQNVSNSCFIGNIWNQPGGSQAVYVNSDGKLGFQVSSRRFKDEIRPVDKASEAIYALKPVSFRYKAEIEPTRPRGFGLVAEDVQNVNPDLVLHDADGNPASVRYDAVNAMLLNEFLKEHKKVQELEAIVAQQQKGMELLNAQLKEQTGQIRKLSAQVQLSSASRRTARNNQ